MLATKYKLTEQNYKEFEALDNISKSILLGHIEELHYAFNCATVHSFLESYHEENILLADGESTGLISTDILHDPYHVIINLKQKPEHLKILPKTSFNKQKYGITEEKLRWILLMNSAFKDLKAKGLKPFEKPIVAIYNFRFCTIADTDNYSVRILNNCIRDVGLIKDDTFEHISTHYIGEIDLLNPGVEIILLHRTDFPKYFSNQIINDR